MLRHTVIRLVVSLLVLVCAGAVALTSSPRLGLDLKGGTQLVLEVGSTKALEADAASTDQVVEVLRRRVDALGVTEPTLVRSGEDRIIIELPGVTDPQEAKDTVGRTAQLSFRPVLGQGDPERYPADAAAFTDPSDAVTLPDEDGLPLDLGPAALTGEGVEGASAALGPNGVGQEVVIDFRNGGREWAVLTGAAACNPEGDPGRRVAIVLDQEVISSPQVNSDVACRAGITGGTTRITGNFTSEEAQGLAVLVEGGSLPLPVELIEQRTVGPTLGADAIEASGKAALLGLLGTALFIIVVYRLFGGLAAVALGVYGLLAYASLVALGATLTLPGLAGLVLTIGMAVDANVLIFERAREEYAKRPDLGRAARVGFKGATSAIVDSNVTTLLAAGLLFFLAAGPVRGFGVTLSLGVIVSMFTALVLSRGLVELFVRQRWALRHPRITGVTNAGWVRRKIESSKVDLMRHSSKLLAGTLLVTLILGSGLLVRGPQFGIEFTGGRLVEIQGVSLTPEEMKERVLELGVEQPMVQYSGEEEISIRAGEITDEQLLLLREDLEGDPEAGDVEVVRDEIVGASLGDELRNKALIALGVALLAQLLYLAIRFRWTWGVGAIVAMAHDVIILLGVFAWLGRPFDGIFLAALLTVIGYSINDTVVIFDRVREERHNNPKERFSVLANRSALLTIPRTVNTGIGALFILGALAFLGGDSLQDFALALIIGVLVGTYSSVIVAVPLTVIMERLRPTPESKPDSSGRFDKSYAKDYGDGARI